MRVKDVNNAKEILATNRHDLTMDVKRQMVTHIKNKMQIIKLIEEELAMEKTFKKAVFYGSNNYNSDNGVEGGDGVNNDDVNESPPRPNDYAEQHKKSKRVVCKVKSAPTEVI